jgi:Helix-turn-helix domain
LGNSTTVQTVIEEGRQSSAYGRTAMTVQITRMEHDAAALRQHAARVGEAPVVRRLLALALVLEGRGRAEAATACGMDRQTLRDWIIRYNERGIAGLSDHR